MKKPNTLLFAAVLAILPLLSFAEETNVTAKYIKNPGFESQFTYWTQSSMQTQNNTSFTLKVGSYYVEKWVDSGGNAGNAEVSQTISKLQAGQYRLQAVAQNLQVSTSDKQTGAWIYAGATKIPVNVADTYSVEFTTLGEAINIGFKATGATGNWLCVDDFKLYYLGADIAKMLELLQTQIQAAEQTVTTANRTTPPLMQNAFMEALTKAIAEAKMLDESATAEELGDAALTMEAANNAAKENYEAMKALRTLCSKAKPYTADSKRMAAIYKQALQTAYEAAQAILNLESDENVTKATAALQSVYNDAVASNTAWTALNKQINTANNLNKTDKEGVEALEAVITEAVAVRDRDDATPEEMNAAATALEKAILIFRVANGSGNTITAKTGAIIQGATEIFGRATFSSGTAKEKGLCWSTDEKEPTIYDNRSTLSYTNNGTIYCIPDLKPATLYYVRAYVVSSTYRVSYGDVVKIYTRPLGNVTFDYGNEGDDATNARIYAACEEAVWMWNHIGGIQHFHLSAHYRYGAGAGSGTAECSYGGYMSVSQNTACQRTGTILHEGAHGLGMTPYTDWTNSIYRTDGDRGDWLGPRVDRVIQFLENNSTAKLHGDNQHMWPYGINGSGEDSGDPMLYRANALLVEALSEDGIVHSGQPFITPAYSFAVEEETKYYIKSADTNRGLNTSYLMLTDTGQLRWKAMSCDEVLQNDSCAWTITFNPSTCYYQFTNVSTGRVMNYSSTGTNGIRTSLTANNNSRFQLLSARTETNVNDFTFATRSFWLVSPANKVCLGANANGTTSAVAFNHADGSTTQRWHLLIADEISRFAQANGETVGVRSLDHVQEGTLRVHGGQGVVSVTAIGAGSDVRIYSLDGRLMRHLYIQRDANAHVQLPRGIYIVGSQKVTVR